MEQLDWQVDKTQQECGKHMLDNQLHTDVNFRVGENQETIPANKVILSMRSPVFERMFNGSFQEAEKDPVIPDISSDAFKIVLRYCYYDCLEVPYDLAISTLYAAKKYILPKLEKHARQVLIQKLCLSNIWDILEQSVTIADEELQVGCGVYFEDNVVTVREALHVSNFLTISQKALLAFLHLNDIGDDKSSEHSKPPGICIAEIDLFRACNAWAEAECRRKKMEPSGSNKRTVLGKCLFQIHFPSMLFEDLVLEVYPTGILNQAEKDNLCLYKHKKSGSDCQLEFPTAERKFLAGPKGPVDERYDNTNYGDAKCTFVIELTERVLLSKLWVKSSCQPHTVTVKDEMSARLVSMKPTVQPQAYKAEDGFLLICLEIEPMLLNAGSKYSVNVEAARNKKPIQDVNPPSAGHLTSVQQVSISRNVNCSKYSFLRAVTFSLV